jgi:hypothetical protein
MAAAAFVMAAGAAAAQTPQQIAATWGLFGTWAVDCSAPPGDKNPLYTYVWRQNQVILDRDFGGGSQDSNTITSLRSPRADQIEYLVAFGSTDPPTTRFHVWQKEDSPRRMRIITNRDVASGKLSVSEGRFTDDNSISAWNRRCW